MRVSATATMCHNDDDVADKNHRRVKLICRKTDEGYQWTDVDGDDIGLHVRGNLARAKSDLIVAYSAECWGLKATWI